MTVTTDDLDLTHAERDLRLRVHLPAAEAPDLAAFNGYLPPDAGVAILGGAGRLRSDFELETAGNSGRGEVVLTSNAVRLRFHDLGIAGGLDLRARLAAADLTDDRFRLDGGPRLVLERVSWSELDGGAPSISGPTPGGWWGHFDLERGTVRLTRPLALQSTVAARLKDAGLLLALFARPAAGTGLAPGRPRRRAPRRPRRAALGRRRHRARPARRRRAAARPAHPPAPLPREQARLPLRPLRPPRHRHRARGRRAHLCTFRRPLEWYQSRRALR